MHIYTQALLLPKCMHLVKAFIGFMLVTLNVVSCGLQRSAESFHCSTPPDVFYFDTYTLDFIVSEVLL